MLTKMVNGQSVTCSQEEEKNIRAYWALNDKYPEYTGHCGFDGMNPPAHDMVECRKHHKELLKRSYQLVKAELEISIEIAQEDGNDPLYKSLLAQRKALRNHLDMNFDNCKTVDELRSSIPDPLRPHWNK